MLWAVLRLSQRRLLMLRVRVERGVARSGPLYLRRQDA